jgi:DNA-binding transcriptional MocR family regulator
VSVAPPPARHLSADARTFIPSPIRVLAKYISDPEIFSFAAGVPNPATFPAAALSAAAQRVLAERPDRALQYEVTRGYLPLRERIAARSFARGIRATAEETIVTTGSQQALDLAARAFLDPGDVVLVELPTYVGALVTFAARRAVPVGIRRTAEGIDLAHLEATVTRLRGEGRRASVLYAIPSFQNPSGLTMGRAAREALAAALERLDLLLLEDDPYGEVSFGSAGHDATPVAVRAPERTLYFGSFSKTLSAGFRTGWVHAPSDLVHVLELAKQASDLCSSTFDAAVLDAYLEDNDYDAHLAGLRGFYRDRKEVLLGAMREHFPRDARFTDPAGGLFTWVELPEGLDAGALLPRCVAETKTAYVPGAPFLVEGDGRRFLRMTFAKETDARLVEGTRRLGAFLKSELR